MEAVYGRVTTSIINSDGTYSIIVISNYTDKEFRGCTYIQQPGLNTFPKVGDTVLVLIVANGEYAILGVTSYEAKPDIVIGYNNEVKINSAGVILTGTTITANGEDLTIDNV